VRVGRALDVRPASPLGSGPELEQERVLGDPCPRLGPNRRPCTGTAPLAPFGRSTDATGRTDAARQVVPARCRSATSPRRRHVGAPKPADLSAAKRTATQHVQPVWS